jgi:imidazolonepropionase-like amidohydrolase
MRPPFSAPGLIVAAALLLVSALPARGVAQAPAPTSPAQLIRDVRVFDGERVQEHRSVLLAGGVIRRVGGPALRAPAAEVVDGRGRTLLPGLIDAHVHVPDHAEAAARQALVLGVTTMLDMFSTGDRFRAVKRLEAEDRPDLADLRTAGTGATAPGGHPAQMGGSPFPTLTSPAEAPAFVDARLAEGSDYLKIIHDDGSTWPWTHKPVPMLDTATMRALVDAAHRRGRLAVVHVLSAAQAEDAIRAGADGLAHLFLGDSMPAGFAALAAAHHVFVVPTLTTLYLDCGESPGPALLADARLAPFIAAEWRSGLASPKADPSAAHRCAGADAAVRALVRAGVPLLTGTDAPVPGTTYGASVHAELELLVRDGITPLQALAAATAVPARCFRLADRGRVRPGLRADLLLVDGDPTRDVLHTRDIVAVWKRGVRVPREPLERRD